jgi:pyruvyltransferase
MSNPIPAYWWSPRRSPRTLAVELKHRSGSWTRTMWPPQRAFTNHGDELNAVVLPELLGRPVRWAPLGREDVIGIGSVLVPYLEQGGRGLILGSGDGSATITPERAADVRDRVLAVRGPLVRQAMGLPGDTPLGDPGLAVRGIAGASGTRRGRLVIPHFAVFQDAEHRRALAALRNTGYRVMSPTTSPRAMIAAIRDAEFVVGSSLHGVILSHALGTPTTHISFDGHVDVMPGHKFRDHNETVGAGHRYVPWHTLLDPTLAAAIDTDAVAEAAAISPRIDAIVDGLHRAAAPLRSR